MYSNVEESRIIASPTAYRPRAPAANSLGIQLLKQELFPTRCSAQIGRYKVLRAIGQGGMGSVYACYDETLDRKIAIKVLKLNPGASRDLASARLVREGQALARLSHPNVVTVHEIGTTNSDVFVAMEHVSGTSLDVWASEPTRTWEQILEVFIQAGRGLQAAHRVDIIHRDFKPQNAMINDDGVVKVLDFGLARSSGEAVQMDWLESQPMDEEMSTGLEDPLTRTGALVGTPAFMSPEQLLGQPVTAASDQFSFCVSLYQSLYKQFPFAIESFETLRQNVLTGDVLPAPLRTRVPTWVYRVLRRGLSRNPEARYPSMKELLSKLDGRRTNRKAWSAGFVVCSLISGTLATSAAGASTIEVCPDSQSELQGIWDAEQASTIRQALYATESPRAEEVVEVVLPQLERYAESWRTMRNESCHAHAEERLSSGLFDLQTACLDQRLASLEAAVELLKTPGEQLERLTQTAMALPNLAPCTDGELLLAEVPPPEDQDIRKRVQSHRERLARIEVLHWAGEYEQGLGEIEKIATDVAAMDYLPLRAETDLKRGFLEWELSRTTEAEQSLQRSVMTAVAAKHTRVAAQASSRLLYLRGIVLSKLEQVQHDLPLVESFNHHVSEDVELYAEYLNNTGLILARTGHLQQGHQRLKTAHELRVRNGRSHTPLALGTLSNLANLEQESGNLREAEQTSRRSVELAKEFLGPTANATLFLTNRHAVTLIELGRVREARVQLQAIVETVQSSKRPFLMTDALFGLAQCELKQGNPAAAREHLETALALTPETSLIRDDMLHRLMFAAAMQGDEAKMWSLYTRAVDRRDNLSDSSGYRQSMLGYYHGLGLLQLGHAQQAVEQLEQTTASLTPSFAAAHPATPPRISLALGRAYRLANNLDAAQTILQQTLADIGDRWTHVQAETHHELGRVALAREEHETATHHLSQAVILYTSISEPDFRELVQARATLEKLR